MLPDLYAELRKVAADLGIEEEVVKGLDASLPLPFPVDFVVNDLFP